MALDFMVEQIQLEREPIEYIAVAIEVGNFWIVRLKGDRYQAQMQGSDYLPKTFIPGGWAQLVNKTSKVKIQSEPSRVLGCFEFECDGDVNNQLFNVRTIEEKPLYPFDRWDSTAEAQCRRRSTEPVRSARRSCSRQR